MKKLIGITGRARAGKDSFAKVFLDAGYQRLAFADPLKEATAFIADEPVALYHDDITKEQLIPHLGVTRRQALQGVGKAARDHLGASVWVGRAMRSWEASFEMPTIITDVRYPDEAQAILSKGGIIIEVVRPAGEGLSGDAATHESENGIDRDLVDILVVNDGTLGELRYAARQIIDSINFSSGEHLGVEL